LYLNNNHLHLALVASKDSSKSDNDGGNLFSMASVVGVVVSFLLFKDSEYDVFFLKKKKLRYQ